MNCFQLVKSVLDELYVRIPGSSDAEKDEKINKKLRTLEAQYANLAQGSNVDYRDITTKFAYIYKYVTSHANLVYQIISESEQLRSLLENNKVNVTCVGGGPGSDLLGILKYVMRYNLKPFLRCALFDGDESWGECWSDVDEKLETRIRISTYCQPLNVCSMDTYCNNSKYLNSDLFTFIYFMSEIHSRRKEAEHFFSRLFADAKKGALILYIDNNNHQFYDWFDSLAHDNSWEIIQSDESWMQIDDYSEEKRDLQEYWDKFGFPKIRANVAHRVCRKS
ncbi:MAG: hypothetical protein ABSH41_15580 [Syntrophobacteraceae bacterium]|jgi:hypothetical protein